MQGPKAQSSKPEGLRAGGLFRGSKTPIHQVIRGLGECCNVSSGVWTEAPAAKSFDAYVYILNCEIFSKMVYYFLALFCRSACYRKTSAPAPIPVPST